MHQDNYDGGKEVISGIPNIYNYRPGLGEVGNFRLPMLLLGDHTR